MPDYPGFGIDLRYDPRDNGYPIGAHGSCSESKSDLLPVRELAMMSIMDKITDKPDWHKKVFDDGIIAKWRQEALAIPDEEFRSLSSRGKTQHWDNNGRLTVANDRVEPYHTRPLEDIMDGWTFNLCVTELRAKARDYEKSALIATMDACATVVKSDTLVSSELQASLRDAFSKLKDDQESSPDWHPSSDDMVQDLVHPSMHPLVYGRSMVLKDEVVGISDAIDRWAGKGEVIPPDTWRLDPQRRHWEYGVGGGQVPPDFWSKTYQWLPANVSLQDDGSAKFTSYINNLHPTKHSDIYRTIEKLIETALPAWSQCLSDDTISETSRFPPPDARADDENWRNWIPDDPEALDESECDKVDPKFLEEEIENIWPESDRNDPHALREAKWKVARKPRNPTDIYDTSQVRPKDLTNLFNRYGKSGLQVIVKMASIELTPEKSAMPVGGWHVEGQMNEHICATALYYLDSENITSSSLEFRMQTDFYMDDEMGIGQQAYNWLEAAYGVSLGGGGSPCLQNYGSVETRQGRLLAFPNVFQHRVSPFHLIDPTKPGHRRFIALWLVDPNVRIISTANVPPQQQDWWVDAVFGNTPEARQEAVAKLPADIVALLQDWSSDSMFSNQREGKLPPELLEIVRKHLNVGGTSLPMTKEEAKEHRAKLMQERSSFVKKAEDGWQQHSYNFCEH